MSTSFQPADWDFNFFIQHPYATVPLNNLLPQHIRLQAVAGGAPLKAPDTWDFTELDAVVTPVLGVADHSPEFQIVPPAFMTDSQGRLPPSRFQDFAMYSANLVRYYNKGGFDSNGKHYQSSSPYPILWWGISNEPNINGLSAAEYVQLYNLVVPAMQAVDPRLKFVAVELSDFLDEPQKTIPTFVQNVTAQVDVIGTHYYSSCDQTVSDQSQFDSISYFADHVRYIYSQLQTKPALAKVPVWVTENNVNADYDKGGGVSTCNNNRFVLDRRGTSAFFAAWRPFVFSQLIQAGAQALYHWDFDSDAQYGEVDYDTGKLYLSYWVDYYLARFFPSVPGSTILQASTTDSASVETLATRNDDRSVVVMVANHAVHGPGDNNGTGDPRTIVLDLSALGSFASGTQVTIDSATDPDKGPVPIAITPAARVPFTLNGYGVSFVKLNAVTPRLSPADVMNAASYAGGAVAPGEIVTLRGAGIGPPSPVLPRVIAPGLLDTSLAGTRILFDGVPAPLIYVQSDQVSAVVPYEVAGKTSTQVQIEYNLALSNTLTLPVTAAIPGIFTLDQRGKGPGVIFNQDWSLNSAASPANRGSVVILYATGEGQTQPAGVTGKLAGDPLPKPILGASARIGGLGADVMYAGAAPGWVSGLMQINLRVPKEVVPGSQVPIQFSVGSANSQPGVTVAVR